MLTLWWERERARTGCARGLRVGRRDVCKQRIWAPAACSPVLVNGHEGLAQQPVLGLHGVLEGLHVAIELLVRGRLAGALAELVLEDHRLLRAVGKVPAVEPARRARGGCTEGEGAVGERKLEVRGSLR